MKEPVRTGSTALTTWSLAAAAIAVVALIGWPGALVKPRQMAAVAQPAAPVAVAVGAAAQPAVPVDHVAAVP